MAPVLLFLALGTAAGGVTWTPVSHAPWGSSSVVRSRAIVDGVPVVGADHVSGRQLPRLEAGVAWRVPAADALAPFAEALEGRLAHPPVARRAWWSSEGRLVPVWRIGLALSAPVASWEAWVDARDGRAVRLVPTSRSALGSVYPISPSLGSVEEVELEGLVEGSTLTGEYAEVFSCTDAIIAEGLIGRTECLASARTALPDASGDFVFEPDPGSLVDDPFAEVNLYHHVHVVGAMVEARFGIRPEAPLRTFANFTMSNAFYGDFDGDGSADLAFGQSESGIDFGYDADVVYHEYGHALNALNSDLPFLRADALGVDMTGGALDEGLADVLSLYLTGDPYLGEYSALAFDRTEIRDLSVFRRCPDDLAGEVHHDGRIVGTLGGAMMVDPRLGPDIALDLMFGAAATLGQDVSWTALADALRQAADAAHADGLLSDISRAAVDEYVMAAGIHGCERVVDLVPDVEQTVFVSHPGLRGDFDLFGGGVQLRVKVPEHAWALRIGVDAFAASDDRLGWAMYVREGEPVEHEVISIEALGLAYARPTVFDHEVRGQAESFGVAFTRLSDPPLVPGSTLYISVAGWDPGELPLLQGASGRATVTVRTGGYQAVERPGACASGPAPGWLALPLLALFRRRRRSGVGPQA